MKFAFCLLFIAFVTLNSCRKENSEKKETDTKTPALTSARQCKVRHAKGFTIDYFKGYKLVTIHMPGGNPAQDLRYVLLEKGSKAPASLSDAQVINIPVKNIAVTSSMHIGPLEFLEAEQTLTGLSDLKYVFSPKVRDMIQAGKVVKIGRDTGLNEEKIIEIAPDVVMTVGSPGVKFDRQTILKRAGIPVLVNSEWIETTPLARAEWVKLLAALFNKEELVNQKFGRIEAEYERLRLAAERTKIKPTVLSGLNTKDAWFLPSGDSYMARFFKDAGARYHWANKKADGSLPLNFEAVYPIALQADYWVNVGFDKNDSKASVLAQDRRYADFKSFQNGQLYSYNALVNDEGSNDFFESGTVNPHIVLADLVTIFHPELMLGRQLVYYKKLR